MRSLEQNLESARMYANICLNSLQEGRWRKSIEVLKSGIGTTLSQYYARGTSCCEPWRLLNTASSGGFTMMTEAECGLSTRMADRTGRANQHQAVEMS